MLSATTPNKIIPTIAVPKIKRLLIIAREAWHIDALRVLLIIARGAWHMDAPRVLLIFYFAPAIPFMLTFRVSLSLYGRKSR